MMDERTLASVVQPQPVPALACLVDSSTSAGVAPIDQTSWKAGKRSRATSPSPTNYDPGPAPPSNSPTGYGSDGLSPSSLTKQYPNKRRRLDADVLTSGAAVTATSDDLRPRSSSDTSCDHPVASEPPSCDVGLGVSDVAKDRFGLSPTLAQEKGPIAYDWLYDMDQVTSSTSDQPATFPSPLPHPKPPGFSHYHDTPGNHPAESSGLPTPGCPLCPLPPSSCNPSEPEAMLVEYRPRPNSEAAAPERRSPEPKPQPPEEERDRKDVIESSDEAPVEEEWVNIVWPVKKSSGSDSGDSRHASGLSDDNAPVPDEEWENVNASDGPDEKGRSVSRSERRSQTHLSDQNRSETKKTRKLKACIRCRMQKIKCKADSENPQEFDCLTCREINLDSKKVIHRLPCLRWKLAEVTLFREGGLELTRRWAGVKMKDLGPRDWVNSSDVRTIGIVMASKIPMILKVKKFKPIDGDITCKFWVDGRGKKRRIDIEPYALASVCETANRYEQYLYEHARSALREYASDLRVDSLVRETYLAVLYYSTSCKRSLSKTQEDSVNSTLLEQYFYLWFAARNTLRSAYVVGEETLDMKPIDDPECPYHRTIPVPRMIPAQFDSLGNQILVSARKIIIEGLWKIMAGKNPLHFYFVYLVVFMLLHEVSFTSADRRRRARDNKLNDKSRYDLEGFVESLQEGGNNILSHWHYYKRGLATSIAETESEDKKNALWRYLEKEQVELLRKTKMAYEEGKDIDTWA
ncbi:hypothetical protein F5Y11DRAFT_341084 [Daldinia sp. FL1419]|nr:hypothetical protein F5Y11DRAFT_341084 [Daldinia sp. FL1419]